MRFVMRKFQATPEEIADMHRLRAILDACVMPVVRSLGTRECFAADDRLDVYRLLMDAGLPDAGGSRSGNGPSAAEIRADTTRTTT